MIQAQSYGSVIMRGRFGVFEMRIMLRIVQRTSVLTKGRYDQILKMGCNTSSLRESFAIPVAELVGKKTHNYEPVKAAARNLKAWQVEYYDKSRRIWRLASMVDNFELDENSGVIRFDVLRWVLDYITDFRLGGYRSYELEVGMSLRNPFAARMYLLTCSQTAETYWSLVEFKKMLGLEGKYPQFYDFERRVLIPAAKELEKREVNGFSYSPVREMEGNRRSPVKGIMIRPIKRKGQQKNISEIRKEMEGELPELLRGYLLMQWRFSTIEVVNNMKTLKGFAALKDWQRRLIDISDRARRKRKGHGYLIAAMKNCIKDTAVNP